MTHTLQGSWFSNTSNDIYTFNCFEKILFSRLTILLVSVLYNLFFIEVFVSQYFPLLYDVVKNQGLDDKVTNNNEILFFQLLYYNFFFTFKLLNE